MPNKLKLLQTAGPHIFSHNKDQSVGKLGPVVRYNIYFKSSVPLLPKKWSNLFFQNYLL